MENFEIMPIHCACINPQSGKAMLEIMLAQLGPVAEDLCRDASFRTLVHYAAVCESEEGIVFGGFFGRVAVWRLETPKEPGPVN